MSNTNNECMNKIYSIISRPTSFDITTNEVPFKAIFSRLKEFGYLEKHDTKAKLQEMLNIMIDKKLISEHSRTNHLGKELLPTYTIYNDTNNRSAYNNKSTQQSTSGKYDYWHNAVVGSKDDNSEYFVPKKRTAHNDIYQKYLDVNPFDDYFSEKDSNTENANDESNSKTCIEIIYDEINKYENLISVSELLNGVKNSSDYSTTEIVIAIGNIMRYNPNIEKRITI